MLTPKSHMVKICQKVKLIKKKKNGFGGFQLPQVRRKIKKCKISILDFQCVAKI
jgi:hypothetical protein